LQELRGQAKGYGAIDNKGRGAVLIIHDRGLSWYWYLLLLPHYAPVKMILWLIATEIVTAT